MQIKKLKELFQLEQNFQVIAPKFRNFETHVGNVHVTSGHATMKPRWRPAIGCQCTRVRGVIGGKECERSARKHNLKSKFYLIVIF